MLINTYLDTEDFVHLYYPEDEPPTGQGCGAGARMASKYPARPPSPEYAQVASSSSEMSERDRPRASPPEPPEQPAHRVRAADLYPRLRTHYDEPGIDIGFTPICGEFVQWVGRTADGGTIAMSNYRLHAQPRRRSGPGASMPLRTIDAVEIRDLMHLLVFCKHGRTLKCKFNTSEQCLEWWRRLNGALAPIGSLQETFAAAYAAWAKEQPPASVHKALIKASQAPQRHWFGEELERLGFTTNGAWRVTAVNADYKLCDSYPPLLIVPASIGDDELNSVARFRSMRRVPAAVWRHRGTGAVLARSSQPEVGWLGWRSSEDERLLAAYVTACAKDAGAVAGTQPHKQVKLLILDARSYASAVTNRARGGGCECQQYYTAADIQFMSLPNIHHVRRSFQQMRLLAAEPGDQPNWHSNLERTLWLQYLCGVCRAASVAARAVLAGRPVLVHCSDGWDRTPQILATAQLILDPHYRTLEGFRILIEREWLDFGHKFADRCGHQFGPEDPNERSPIFLQWLEVVYQMMYQYPSSFEFNESYLIKLATHVHSCMFGTFLCNKARERGEARAAECTAHVWQLLAAPAYRNHLYCAPHTHDQVLWPETNIRAMQFWWSMYGGEREELDDDQPEPDVTRQKHAPTNVGLMTKTRSCDNLLNEGEKRTTQRRSSDPSLAPDVMKLSTMMVGGEVRAALTDSFVDDLPALPSENNHNQVEGLRPDHFENQRLSHDIASGSSSLERELAAATNIDKVIDHAIDGDTDNCEPIDKPEDASDVTDGAPQCRVQVKENGDEKSPEETPDEPIFVYDAYGDVSGMAEAARETGRSRHISITWRSVSESSNQSSNGFDIGDTPPKHLSDVGPDQRRDRSLDNHNSTEGDVANHNVINELIEQNGDDGSSNGPLNGELPSKNMEVQLSKVVRSSSVSSESSGSGSGSGAGCAAAGRRARVPSQLTLCPASPRRRCCRCCHCPPHHRTARHRPGSLTSGIETSGDSGGSEACWCGLGADAGGAVRCVCGAGSSDAAGGVTDPLDGLAPAADRMQARLHQIILSQKKLVDGLMVELRQAKELLRQVTSQAEESEAPDAAPASRAPQPSAPPHPQSDGSGVVNGSASSGSGSGTGSGVGSASGSRSGSSASGSASEVEVGEEARGVVWVPDSAAPRCQYCRNHFWLARRRHHCRRCGGIFCSSCSEMSAWGECGAVRVCRTCRER